MTPYQFGPSLLIPSCPHCGTGKPQTGMTQDLGWRGDRFAALYTATCCNNIILAEGVINRSAPSKQIAQLFPSVRVAADEVPEPAKRYLQQAFETLHAPDAAAVMAGSAVDAMLKTLGLIEGSVYARIDQAVSQHKLTQSMGEWAHEVRLGSNRPRHADADHPHVSPQQARQSVEFAEALAHFLFVLSSRVSRGVEAAKAT